MEKSTITPYSALCQTASEEPLCFGPMEYTPQEEFTERLSSAPERRVSVPIKRLAVEGKVVRDSMQKYLAHPALSSSVLKEILISPRHFVYAQENRFQGESTGHFDLGTFIHMAFLEPSRFEKLAVAPPLNRSIRESVIEGIRFYHNLLSLPLEKMYSQMKLDVLKTELESLELMATTQGYTCIDREYKAVIEQIRDRYHGYGNGLLRRLLLNAKTEVSFYGTDPQTGLKIKVRADAIIPEEDFGVNTIVSFKSTSERHLEDFGKQAARYRYPLTEGMYRECISRITGRAFSATLMVVFQTVAPYEIAVFYWREEDLEAGGYMYREAVARAAECHRKNCFPGFETYAEPGYRGIIELKLPASVQRELEPTCVEL